MLIEGEDLMLWRVQVSGTGIDILRTYDASGREIARNNAVGGFAAQISNLLLAPGEHSFSVRGTDGNYTLRFLPIGPAPDLSRAPEVPAATHG